MHPKRRRWRKTQQVSNSPTDQGKGKEKAPEYTTDRSAASGSQIEIQVDHIDDVSRKRRKQTEDIAGVRDEMDIQHEEDFKIDDDIEMRDAN